MHLKQGITHMFLDDRKNKCFTRPIEFRCNETESLKKYTISVTLLTYESCSTLKIHIFAAWKLKNS